MPSQVRSRLSMVYFMFTANIGLCSEIDVPVQLNCVGQEVWIRPGDIILGDADGVVCLPRSLAIRVIEMLPKLVSGINHFYAKPNS